MQQTATRQHIAGSRASAESVGELSGQVDERGGAPDGQPSRIGTEAQAGESCGPRGLPMDAKIGERTRLRARVQPPTLY